MIIYNMYKCFINNEYTYVHNVHLKNCPSRILLLFPRYNNLYNNYFHNFKLPEIKSSRHHKSLSFKGPKLWNNVYLNKLLFTKIYIKSFKKILNKHLLLKYENKLNNLLSKFIIFYGYYLLYLQLVCFIFYFFIYFFNLFV